MNFFEHPDNFTNRHIGPSQSEKDEMLKVIGVNSLDTLIDETIPKHIRLETDLQLNEPLTEYRFLEKLKRIAKKNKVFKSYIGMGYYNTMTPAVIQRNILENPGWYTQYTPYQAEIAQGRLEALMIFQTMIIDFTGLPVANASLLDEGTSAAEAMIMFYNMRKNKNANTFLVASDIFPQTLSVLQTRSNPLGIKLKVTDVKSFELNDNVFGILVQYPNGYGDVTNYKELFDEASSKKIYCTCAADLLSLALLIPPGEFGADAVVGTTQRFGVPMGFGGPHAAYFAVKDEYKRNIPGRIIGLSVDANGNKAYRMALQTREQHIRREKATSNICTAQVLLAIMAGMYAVYHGPKGIRLISERIHKFTKVLNEVLRNLGYKQTNNNFFDTLRLEFSNDEKSLLQNIQKKAIEKEVNFRYIDENSIGISINETTDLENLIVLAEIFSSIKDKKVTEDDLLNISKNVEVKFPEELTRKSSYLTFPVFNQFHSETEMMRYLKSLENKDLSLTHSMIPLGSCTMKLNSVTEMLGITWPEFSKIHPFAPTDQVQGYKELISELEDDLKKITGFEAVSFQPNSGAQGEYAGLMVIRQYHIKNGNENRTIMLIPSSAHGTNPASAVMAGMKIIVVPSDENGNINVDELKKKAIEHKDDLAGLMVTYPSTHGIFESAIKEICNIIHENGGLVYMDGANMNAQVGLTSPAAIGADVCHLNLHKTFSIPHGGGGPGMGPIAVAKHLVDFLPNHPINGDDHKNGIEAVSAANYGSASILIISYAYIKMMGGKGLTEATKNAILNANYIKAVLENDFKVLYTGEHSRVAHELIFDLREYKKSHIEVEDVAKRLMDYGYHAPTVSFPVPGTLMVEPTESESKHEIDKFCEALKCIKQEIEEVVNGTYSQEDNVLKNSPHTALSIISGDWNHTYSREKAAYPNNHTKNNKFWPSSGRINNAYGDRSLICSCNSISDYQEA